MMDMVCYVSLGLNVILGLFFLVVVGWMVWLSRGLE
jgi:hypothetical protein